jgi:IS605 OrfB family transposase
LNHTISRQLVEEAKNTGAALAFEDLTGIRQRAKVRGKDQRRQHNNWAFYQLRQFTSYKAAIAGVPVLLVNPAYTSKTCHQCLHIGHRDGKSFKCENCGWHGDADFNAANVISLVGLSVTQPERSILACSLQATG